MIPVPERHEGEPTPEAIEAALDALHEGSPDAFDRLLDPVTEGSSGICGLFVDMTMHDPHDGETPTIAGYRIDRVLAAGGMGIVYAAEQEATQRTVAVKVIRSGFGSSAPAGQLFQREISTLVRLRHPNIADVYDAGKTREGTPFFAMELIEGRTLKDAMAAAGETDPRSDAGREVLQRFIAICRAMNHAHQRGVIHCDLKPTNVMIAADGTPKVLDFGLSRLIDPEVTTIAAATAQQLVGTLAYMSPEQASGPAGELDIRSDVYSLGVMLYELLCGKPPYRVRGSAIPAAIRTICETEPTRPASIRPALKGDLDAIVMKALEKEPSRRYQSAGDLADDLERSLRGEPIEARSDRFYLLRRTLYRYRVQAGVAAAFFAVLMTATGVSAWFWYQAQQETQRAEVEAERAHKVGNTAIYSLGEMMNEIYEITLEVSNQPRKIDRLYQELERLTDAIEMDSDLEYVRWTFLDLQARMAYGLGKRAESKKLFHEIAETASPETRWYARAHMELAGMGDADEARPHFDAAMQVELSDKYKCHLTRQFATALVRSSRYEEALDVLDSAPCPVSDIERRMVIAEALEGAGRMKESIHCCELSLVWARRRVKGDPRQFFHKLRLLKALRGLATAYFNSGDLDRAFTTAEEAKELSTLVLKLKPLYAETFSESWHVHRILYEVYYARGELDKADEFGRYMAIDIGRLAKMEPEQDNWTIDRAETRYQWGKVLYELGDYRRATIRTEALVESIPILRAIEGRRPFDHYNRSAEYLRLAGQVADGRRQTSKAVDYHRQSVAALLELREIAPDDCDVESRIVKHVVYLSEKLRASHMFVPGGLDDFARDAMVKFREKRGEASEALALESLIEQEFQRVVPERFCQSRWPRQASDEGALASTAE